MVSNLNTKYSIEASCSRSVASLCELTSIACLKRDLANKESIAASRSKALLHFVNKKLNYDCVFEAWFRKYRINRGFNL